MTGMPALPRESRFTVHISKRTTIAAAGASTAGRHFVALRSCRTGQPLPDRIGHRTWNRRTPEMASADM